MEQHDLLAKIAELEATVQQLQQNRLDEYHNYFGNTDEIYDITRLRMHLKSGSIRKTQIYLATYFAPAANSTGYYKYEAAKNTITFIATKDLHHHIPRTVETNGKPKWNALEWVVNNYDARYHNKFRVNQPLVFTNKHDQLCLNHFKGFMHRSYHPYAEYSSFCKKGVQMVWDHIKTVWCSDNPVLFDYVQKWVSHMCVGKKQTTALYLKSIQGTGKSIITDFLMTKVLGKKIAHLTSDTNIICGGFNSQLVGKICLILEELPSASTGVWNSLGNNLKQYITGDLVEIRQKYKDSIQYKNPLSIILLSNNNAIKLESSDRRFISLDISSKYRGNTDYFRKLGKYVNNKKVGEAFFSFCHEYVNENPHFDSQKDRPMTESKKENIIENMHTFYQFLKLRYVLKGKGIRATRLGELMTNYLKALSFDATKVKTGHVGKYKKHDTNISAKAISKLLEDIGIQSYRGTKNQVFVKCDFEELRDSFEAHGFLHELDEEDEYEPPLPVALESFDSQDEDDDDDGKDADSSSSEDEEDYEYLDDDIKADVDVIYKALK